MSETKHIKRVKEIYEEKLNKYRNDVRYLAFSEEEQERLQSMLFAEAISEELREY